ncbi:MAG: ribosomal protein L7/L12 [Treponema sp.]|nr:ribosomal protein L7/L12 [Treponema sp.]
MKCPSCKNPITDNSTICEWCGNSFIKEDFDIVGVLLKSFDDAKKIAIIKEIRTITGLGLKEAKDLAENVPSVIKNSISMQEAKQIENLIVKCGGSVEILKANEIHNRENLTYRTVGGIIIPNSNTPKSGACYIATVCYGDYDCPQLLTFRNFRDDYLSNNIFGKIFIRVYYYFSPSIARWLKNKYKINTFVRKYILNKIYISLKSYY